jgi:hypothetical protein
VSEAACFACGVAQPYGQIRCDVCGEPLVFPKSFTGKKKEMIEPTEADIGRTVLYTGNRFVGGKTERGVITGFNHWTVFVRYGADAQAMATSREDLEWESMKKPDLRQFAGPHIPYDAFGRPMTMTGKFRDITALEVLRTGESEAHARLLEAAVFMEGFARGADARFAAIEARLKALEERDAAVPGGAGFGRVVSPTPRQADIEQLPPDRNASGSAVEAGGEVPLPAGGGTATPRDDGR